jgi:hypothetical protein
MKGYAFENELTKSMFIGNNGFGQFEVKPYLSENQPRCFFSNGILVTRNQWHHQVEYVNYHKKVIMPLFGIH